MKLKLRINIVAPPLDTSTEEITLFTTTKTLTLTAHEIMVLLRKGKIILDQEWLDVSEIEIDGPQTFRGYSRKTILSELHCLESYRRLKALGWAPNTSRPGEIQARGYPEFDPDKF